MFHTESFTIPLSDLKSERKDLIDLYNSYYDNVPPFPRLDEQDPDRIKPRVSLGLPKLFINRRASSLFGKDKFAGFGAFKFSNSGEKEILQQIWLANKMDTKLIVTAKQALRLGDAFIKLTFSPSSRKKVIYQRINTEDIFPILDFQNIEEPLGYVIQFLTPDGTWYREEISTTATRVFRGAERKKGGLFASNEYEVHFELVETYIHNLGFLPIVHIRNNEQDGEFWSQSLLQGLPPILDNLNEIISNVCYAIGEQADPLLWLKGVKKGDNLYKDADAVWYFESPDAALNVLQWSGTPESVFSAFDRLINNAYECAQLPIILARDEKISNVSGAALKILLQDMVDAVSEARSLWEESFRELFAKTLYMVENLSIRPSIDQTEIDSQIGEEEVLPFVPDFTIAWGDILPKDEQIFNNDLYTGLDAKIYSRKEVLRKKGYSDDYIEKLLKEIEDDNIDDAESALSDDELEEARLTAAQLMEKEEQEFVEVEPPTEPLDEEVPQDEE